MKLLRMDVGDNNVFRMKDMAKVGEYSRVLVKAKSVPPRNRVKLDTIHN